MADRDDVEQNDVLAWYVNGTLAPPAYQAIEDALGGDRVLARDERFLRDVAAALRFQHAGYDEFGSRAALMRKLQRDQTESIRGKLRDWWHRSIPQWLEPKVAIAMLVIAGQAAVIGVLIRDGEHHGYSEFRSPPQEQTAELQEVSYRVTFRPDAPEQQIRTLLITAGARIIDGPSQLGDYYIAVSPEKEAERVKLLHASELVDSMEKVRRAPHAPVAQ